MIDAALVIDKPAGMTSHDVVNRVRRIVGERSVGHLGTLDPMATGVLPLLLGRYTRLAQFFKESAKLYEGEMRFGFATDTYDADGAPVGESHRAAPTLEELRRYMPRFQGRVQQRPPNFSAKKIGGVAAYKLARQQRAVELKPVEIEIFRFEILAVVGERATFVAEVSAGAYIRSLAHELGQLLGCGAHLSALRRARAGEFDLSQAVTLEQLGASFARREVELSECPLSDEAVGAESCCLMHPRQLLRALPNITATPEQLAGLRNGRPVNLPDFSSEPLVKVFANQSLLVAIAQRIAGTLFQPKVVLFGSNEPLPD